MPDPNKTDQDNTDPVTEEEKQAAELAAKESESQDNTEETNEEFFLTVNDRTQFRTKEDAIKSFDEGGKRIAELTGWEKKGKDYGFDDPEDLDDSLQDYARLKEAEEQSSKGKSDDEAKGGKSDSTVSLTDKEQEWKKWLTDPDKAALVTRKELEELQSSIKSSREEEETADFETNVEDARATLKSLMETNKLPTDAKNFARTESYVRSWMEDNSLDKDDSVRPGSPLAKFHRGGKALQSAMEEGFNDLLDFKGHKAAADDYAEKKRSAQNSSDKVPPKGTGALAKSSNSKKHTDFTPELNSEAWEMFQNLQKSEDGKES